MFVSILFLALLSSLILTSTGLNVITSHKYQQIKPGEGYTVICQADVPLIGCQMKEYLGNTFYELSKGKESQSSRFQYAGNGLAYGQCGIYVPETIHGGFYDVLVCRVRASGSGWMHAVSVIHSRGDNVVTFPVEAGPHTRIAEAGTDVIFEYLAADEIVSCGFKWHFQREWVSTGGALEYAIDNTRLKEGHCSLTLHSVVPESSGFVEAEITALKEFKVNPNETESYKPVQILITTLIVMEAPTKPILTAQECGRVVEPSCMAGPARPPPVLIWLRGNIVIRTDDTNDVDTGHWVWEYEAQSITQYLNERLARANLGQNITCRVAHIAIKPNGTLDSQLSMPTAMLFSNVFLFIVYLLIGIGTIMLGAALAVAGITIYKYLTVEMKQLVAGTGEVTSPFGDDFAQELCQLLVAEKYRLAVDRRVHRSLCSFHFCNHSWVW